MKFKYLLGLLLLTVSANTFASSHGGGNGQGNYQKNSGIMHPMPNFMRVIMKHGDQLNLTEKQSKALASWRAKSHHVMQAKMARIKEVRTELQEAVIDGANRAEINIFLGDIDRVRSEIVATKLKCRRNMQSLLSDEQWNKLTTIYRANFM